MLYYMDPNISSFIAKSFHNTLPQKEMEITRIKNPYKKKKEKKMDTNIIPQKEVIVPEEKKNVPEKKTKEEVKKIFFNPDILKSIAEFTGEKVVMTGNDKYKKVSQDNFFDAIKKMSELIRELQTLEIIVKKKKYYENKKRQERYLNLYKTLNVIVQIIEERLIYTNNQLHFINIRGENVTDEYIKAELYNGIILTERDFHNLDVNEALYNSKSYSFADNSLDFLDRYLDIKSDEALEKYINNMKLLGINKKESMRIFQERYKKIYG